MPQLISFIGIFAMIFLAWLMSSHKRRISLRVVFGGVLLQFAFAWLMLKTAPGQEFFKVIGAAFEALLGFTNAGAEFVFGDKKNPFHPFAFSVLPTIIFFSTLMAVLYYLKIMQVIVHGIGWVVRRTLGTTGAETLSAAANIFLGQTEAPLCIRPYIRYMTISELMAVMVPGFGSAAVGVLALYEAMGKVSAGHLFTASVMSAPASLLIAKMILPETEQPPDTRDIDSLSENRRRLSASFHPSPLTGEGRGEGVAEQKGTVPLSAGDSRIGSEAESDERPVNLIEAASIGASQGVKLAINVAAMLIAFIALVAMCDASVGYVGKWFGHAWSLSAGLSYVFAPIAWLMGIEKADCLPAGELLGLKMVTNEVVAFTRMGDWANPESLVHLSERTKIILTYAIFGFANFASIGIQLGGIGGMAPQRRADLARIGFRAMLGGTLSTCMMGCIAGVLI
jgi:concentrative nucleoside transporter, CNT family